MKVKMACRSASFIAGVGCVDLRRADPIVLKQLLYFPDVGTYLQCVR